MGAPGAPGAHNQAAVGRNHSSHEPVLGSISDRSHNTRLKNGDVGYLQSRHYMMPQRPPQMGFNPPLAAKVGSQIQSKHCIVGWYHICIALPGNIHVPLPCCMVVVIAVSNVPDVNTYQNQKHHHSPLPLGSAEFSINSFAPFTCHQTGKLKY